MLKWRAAGLFIALTISLFFVGCGGGSGSSDSSNSIASQTVTGVAAAGAPLIGTVYLKDSSSPANELSAPIEADGSFSFNVYWFTPPFLLKAVGTVNNNNFELYSFAPEAGIANINPLSHLSVAMANGSDDLATLYTVMGPAKIQAIKNGLSNAIANLRTVLQPTLSQFEVSTVNFISDTYLANHQGLDMMLDLVGISVANGSVIVVDKMVNTTVTSSLNDFLTTSINIAPPNQAKTVGNVLVMPIATTVVSNGEFNFSVVVVGTYSQQVTWNVVEANGGTITNSGVYTAPATAGTYHIIATNSADPTKSAMVPVKVTPPNNVDLQSDNGDYIGGGQTYNYTNINAQITVSATSGHLSVSIHGDQNWQGDFQVPINLSQLQSGYYGNLMRYPFNNPVLGGLSWYGEGRGSNTLTGWFTIDNVTYVNGTLTEIDMRFEQHSEGGIPALHGQIHWSSYDTTTPSEPINPPPAGLWQPVAGSTPSDGNYVYLQSDNGDYIGGGQTYNYTNTNAQINVSATGGYLSVSIHGDQSWQGNFKAMINLSQLQPGYYGNLMRYPFNNPVRGGLSWYGEGRGSNTLTGWFAIDNVTYVNGILTGIDMRFEQHSEGGIPALHGKIHWIQ
jgi:hypothetical protein